jgi:hypothetical protein
MRNLLLLFAAPFFICAGCGPGGGFQVSSLNPTTDISAPMSTVSYEMYSWPGKLEWNYAVFEPATRISSFAEITGGDNTIIGTEALITSLAQMPKGTKVYWNLKRIKGFSLPDERTLGKIVTAAQKAGVDLEVIAWPN